MAFNISWTWVVLWQTYYYCLYSLMLPSIFPLLNVCLCVWVAHISVYLWTKHLLCLYIRTQQAHFVSFVIVNFKCVSLTLHYTPINKCGPIKFNVTWRLAECKKNWKREKLLCHFYWIFALWAAAAEKGGTLTKLKLIMSCFMVTVVVVVGWGKYTTFLFLFNSILY